MTKKKIFIIAGVVVIASTLAAFKIRNIKSNRETLSPPVKRATINEGVYGIGTVTATRSYQLKIGVSSTVRKLYVKEGDTVKKGQKLIDLDSTGNFTAPFDGTITFLPVKVGESVFAQSVLMSVVDLTDRYILVSLEQRGVIRVAQGQKAKISFENMRDQSFEGVTESVYSNENNFLVRIGVSNLPPQILPGMSADVSISVAEKNNVIVIPISAIDKGKVRLKRNGKTETVIVKTGVIDGEMAELTSDTILEGDELYIPKKAVK